MHLSSPFEELVHAVPVARRSLALDSAVRSMAALERDVVRRIHRCHRDSADVANQRPSSLSARLSMTTSVIRHVEPVFARSAPSAGLMFSLVNSEEAW